MKWLVPSLVFFFLLQLQCAQGASLADKAEGDEPEIEDTGGERIFEDEDNTNSETKNEIQEAQQDIESPTQTKHQNTTNDSKQEEKHPEDSSLHESSESEEDLENKTPRHTLTSIEEINGESSNSTKLAFNDTLPKNETRKRTLQTGLRLGSTIGGVSALNLGVGGSNTAIRPSTSTSFTAGFNQEAELGSGLNSQQTTAIRPAVDSSASSTVNSWPTAQGNLNTNAFAGGGIQNNQQQSRPSVTAGNQVGVTTTNQNRPTTAVDSSASSTVNNWPTAQGNLNTNAFAGGAIQNNQQQSRPSVTAGSQVGVTTTNQNRPSTAVDSNASSTVNNWPTAQGNLNTNAFAGGAIQNNQQQSRPSVTAGSQVGVTTTNQNRPSTAVDSSALSTVNNWPTAQGNLNTNAFAGGAIQNNQQQSRPSVTAGSQVGVTTTNQNRPSTAVDSNASSTVNNWPTAQGNLNTNAFAGGAIQNNQQQSRPSVTAGSQVGVTTTNQNRPSTANNANATSTTNNWPAMQGGLNSNAFAGGAIQNNQQQSRPSVTAGSQVGVTTTNQNRPSTANNANATSTTNNWPAMQGGLNSNAFAGGAIQNNQQESRPSVTAGSLVGITTTNQNRPSTTINANATSTANNWQAMQGGLNSNAFAGSTIQNNQQQSKPSFTAGSQVGITTTNQNRPSTAINATATSIVNNWPTTQSNLNANAFAGGVIQNNQQQSRPSVTAGSLVGITTTNQNRPSTTINANATSTANNWQAMQGGLNSNAFAGSTIQNNQQQSKPSLTAGSQVGITTTNQNRPSTAINATATSIVNNWPTTQSNLNANAFAGGVIQNNQQQSRPSVTAGSQVGLAKTNQNRPSAVVNANATSTTSNWPTAQSNLNANAFAGGAIQSSQQLSRPSFTAGSQVGVTTTNQNRPSTAINANATSTANNWQAMQGGLNSNAFAGSTVQNSQQQSRPSPTAGSQVGVTTTNQNRPSTANGLEPLTKITQLMKVMEVVSNVTSGNVPGPVSGTEGNVNIAQGSHLQQNIVREGQGTTKFNTQYNNVLPTKDRWSLDDLTKIVQLLKVIEVVSNVTSDEESQFKPEQSTQMDSKTNTLRPYNANLAGMSDTQLYNGPSRNSQGNINSNVAFISRPTSETGEKLASYVPNYQNNYVPHQTSTTNYDLNQFDKVSLENKLTAAGGVNVIGGLTNSQQFLPEEHTTASTVASSNFNNVASSEQALYQGVSESTVQNNLATSGSGQAIASTSPSSSGTKRRSLTNLVKTVELLDAIRTLSNINNPEQKYNKTSEFLTGNTNQHAELQNEAIVLSNLNSNTVAQISTGHYGPQEVPQPNYIEQRPYLTTQGEDTQHIETDMNLSNMAEIRPTTTINNQQNNRPTLSLQNSKGTGSLDINPNYQQQISPSMAGEAQAGIDSGNQYRPITAMNTGNNITSIQSDYNMNGFADSKQQIRPSATAVSQAEIVNNEQYRPNAEINTNAQTMINNFPTIQGDYNVNGFADSNQYNEQQMRPSVVKGSQTGPNNNQYRPNAVMNASAGMTVNNIPIRQDGVNLNDLVGFNQYREQQVRPSVAAGAQTGFGNNNQYKQNSAFNTSAATAINSLPSPQGDINMNNLADFNQYKKQQIMPSLAAGGQATFENNNQFRPFEANVQTTISNNPTIQDDYNIHGFPNTIPIAGSNQYNQQQLRPFVDVGSQTEFGNNYQLWPNATFNAGVSTMANNFSTIQGDYNKNLADSNQYNEQQNRQSVEAQSQTEFVNSNQYRPLEASNANVPSTVNNIPAIQGSFNMNEFAGSNQYDGQQMRPSVDVESQAEMVNNNQYQPNAAINAGAPTMVNNFASVQGDLDTNDLANFHQNNVQQIKPSVVTGSQTGLVNNLYRPNEAINTNGPTMVNNYAAMQGDYDMNDFSGFNQFNEQQINPSSGTEIPTKFLNNYQYRPDLSLNANTATTMNASPTMQGGINMNDLADFNQYNEQQFRPSVAVGSQTGVVINNLNRPDSVWNTGVPTTANNSPMIQGGNNQYWSNVALNASADTMVNNLQTMEGGINMNDFSGINLNNNQETRPSMVAEGETGYLNNNQYRPFEGSNANAQTTISNNPTQDDYNMNGLENFNQYNDQQMRPSVVTESQIAIGNNNQFRPNVPWNTGAPPAINNLPIPQASINMNDYDSNNQYDQQQFRPSVATGSETGVVNNQYTQNAAFNVNAQTTVNNHPTLQGGINMNEYDGINQYNQQQVRPSVTAGSQTGIINNQYMPNAAFNVNAPTSVNNLPTAQGGFDMNEYDDINQYNQQQVRPSLTVGTQTGVVNNQYTPNAAYNEINQYNQQQVSPSVATGSQIGLVYNNLYTPNTASNANTPSTVNNLPIAQGGIIMNEYDAINQHNQQQERPSVTVGTQTGVVNNQYTPNTGYNAIAPSTINYLPTAQGDINMNGYESINQYNQQQIRPSMTTGTQAEFNNNQYAPNADFNGNTPTTVNNLPTAQGGFNMNDLASFNEQQVRPLVAAGSQANIVTNNQNMPTLGLNTTGNTLPVQGGGKVNQSDAVNQNNKQHINPSVAVESQTGLISKIQSRPTSVINANSMATTQGELASNRNQQQSQSSVKAESQVDLTTATKNIKPPATHLHTNSKDNSLNQTSTLRSQTATKTHDEKKNTEISNQDRSIQAKNSSTATMGNQPVLEENIQSKDHSGVNLNQQIKPSNTAETETGSVTSNQQMPSIAFNPSAGTNMNNLLIPLANPTMNTYVTGNQILPQSAISNNPSGISEYHLNTSSYNSKLIQESSQNHTSEIIRNQLHHSTPTIQGQLLPSVTGTSNYSQSDNPLSLGGASSVNIHNGNQIISREKENNFSSSLNNNNKIASNSPSIGLNGEGVASLATNAEANNTIDKEETSRSRASEISTNQKQTTEAIVQAGISSSPQKINSSTAKESKTPGSSETRSKAGSGESSSSKIQTQANTDVGYSKISSNTSTKEHNTTEESQNQRTAITTTERTPITKSLIPSLESGTMSHVDCIKKEPLSNGSISITTVGNCMMHQEHDNAEKLDNKQASGSALSSTVKDDVPVNSSVGGSLTVNATANNRNEFNNTAAASSDASFNATIANTNKGKSQVATSSGVASAEASSKLQNQSQASTGLSLSVGI